MRALTGVNVTEGVVVGARRPLASVRTTGRQAEMMRRCRVFAPSATQIGASAPIWVADGANRTVFLPELGQHGNSSGRGAQAVVPAEGRSVSGSEAVGSTMLIQ
jgi:hypothetical protein